MSRHRRRLRTGNEGWLTSYADLMTNLLIFFVVIVSASEIQTGRMERIISSLSGKSTSGSLEEAKQTVEKTIAEQNLSSQITAQITDSGLELSFNSGVTFASGKADIKPEMLAPLEKVLAPLVPLANKYHFAVEGHADPVPIGEGSAFKSNWELSSARSLAVREELDRLHVPKERIRVEAYADTRPLPEDRLKGLSKDEALARNRRVVVRLY